MKCLFVLLAIIATALPASAADSFEQALCAGSDRGIQITLDNINLVDGWIELVPTDEAAYLSKEYKAALNDSDDRRFNLVVARPYFRAWEVHESFAKARNQIETVQRQMTASEKLKYRIILAVFGTHLVSSTRLAYQEYLSAENIHSAKMSDGDTVLAGAESGIDMYLNCLVEKLDDK